MSRNDLLTGRSNQDHRAGNQPPCRACFDAIITPGTPSLHGSVGFVLERSAPRGPYAGSPRPTILVLLPGPSNPVPGGRRHLATVLRFDSDPKLGRRPADATAALVRRGICAEHVIGRDRVRAAEPPCPRIEPRRAGPGPSLGKTLDHREPGEQKMVRRYPLRLLLPTKPNFARFLAQAVDIARHGRCRSVYAKGVTPSRSRARR